MLSSEVNSQGLNLKEYCLLVNAPTGHKSIILPEISEFKISFLKNPICVKLPRPKVPKIEVSLKKLEL